MSGFVGQHLAQHLAASDERVAGIGREAPLAGLDAAYRADLLNAAAVRAAVAACRPDTVYHLAAQSSVPESWADPAGTIANNIVCQVNLLEAVRQEQLDPMLVIAISSEVYGQVPADELPVSERALLRPLSPYAVSKAGQDLLAYQYAAARHMRIIRLRVFNHIGPGQSDRFVVSNFARQLIEVERGERPPVLEVGDLTTQRDFCDVRDIVRAYHLAATYCTSGEAYNVGSGIPRTMHAVLNALIALSRVQVEVRTDPARLRPADVPVMWCDSSRFRDATGWHCTIPFEQSLRDVLDDWRARLASQQHRQV